MYPLDALAEAFRAVEPRVELMLSAGAALLNPQFVPLASVPIRARLMCRRGDRFADLLSHQICSLPSIALQCVDMIPPCPWTNEIFAFFTCRGPHSPRNCFTASVIENIEPGCPGWQCDSSPPCVLIGSSPPSSIRPPSTNRPPSPSGQKPRSSSSMITTGVKQS